MSMVTVGLTRMQEHCCTLRILGSPRRASYHQAQEELRSSRTPQSFLLCSPHSFRGDREALSWVRATRQRNPIRRQPRSEGRQQWKDGLRSSRTPQCCFLPCSLHDSPEAGMNRRLELPSKPVAFSPLPAGPGYVTAAQQLVRVPHRRPRRHFESRAKTFRGHFPALNKMAENLQPPKVRECGCRFKHDFVKPARDLLVRIIAEFANSASLQGSSRTRQPLLQRRQCHPAQGGLAVGRLRRAIQPTRRSTPLDQAHRCQFRQVRRHYVFREFDPFSDGRGGQLAVFDEKRKHAQPLMAGKGARQSNHDLIHGSPIENCGVRELRNGAPAASSRSSSHFHIPTDIVAREEYMPPLE